MFLSFFLLVFHSLLSFFGSVAFGLVFFAFSEEMKRATVGYSRMLEDVCVLCVEGIVAGNGGVAYVFGFMAECIGCH